MKCSICKKEIKKTDFGWDKGNNAEPINSGRCCDKCNEEVVLIERIRQFKIRNRGEN